MSEATEQLEAAEVKPKVTYLRVYLLSGIFIAMGLSTISVRVAIALGIILLPAHAIAIGLISRIQPWRPVFLKIWPITAFVIALLFILPARVIYQMATTPTATFKQLVLNPVPDDVENIEKKAHPDAQTWVSLTFDLDPKTVNEVLETQSFELVSFNSLDPELIDKLGRVRQDRAKVYQVNFAKGGVRVTAMVNSRSNRMCFVYERGLN